MTGALIAIIGVAALALKDEQLKTAVAGFAPPELSIRKERPEKQIRGSKHRPGAHTRRTNQLQDPAEYARTKIGPPMDPDAYVLPVV